MGASRWEGCVRIMHSCCRAALRTCSSRLPASSVCIPERPAAPLHGARLLNVTRTASPPSCMPRHPKTSELLHLKEHANSGSPPVFSVLFLDRALTPGAQRLFFPKKKEEEVISSSSNRIELQADNGRTVAILNSGEETSF